MVNGDKDFGKSVVAALIKTAVGEEGFKSESALARAMGIGANKLNRWKNGLYPVSKEGLTLAMVLLALGDAKEIKRTLHEVNSIAEAINNIERFRELVESRTASLPKNLRDLWKPAIRQMDSIVDKLSMTDQEDEGQ